MTRLMSVFQGVEALRWCLFVAKCFHETTKSLISRTKETEIIAQQDSSDEGKNAGDGVTPVM